MVRYNINDITEDMILGESLFLPSGELLLAAGYRLQERYRKRLIDLGFSSVLITIDGTESVIPETIIATHIQREMSLSINNSAKDIADALPIHEQGSRNIQKTIRENKPHLNRFIMS
jgi:hypothetical protein